MFNDVHKADTLAAQVNGVGVRRIQAENVNHARVELKGFVCRLRRGGYRAGGDAVLACPDLFRCKELYPSSLLERAYGADDPILVDDPSVHAGNALVRGNKAPFAVCRLAGIGFHGDHQARP